MATERPILSTTFTTPTTPQRAEPMSTKGEMSPRVPHLYEKDIGNIPHLTLRDEEVLSRLVQFGLQASKLLSQPANLSTEEIASFEEIVREGQKARTRMVEVNLGLVIRIAKYYTGRGVAFADLIQEGNLGLMDAVDRFDPEPGNRFSTHAYRWIRRDIIQAINKERILKPPIDREKQLNELNDLSRELKRELGHQPSDDDLREALITQEGLSTEAVDKIMHAWILNTPFSLDKLVGDGKTTDCYALGSEALNPEEIITETISPEAFEQLLSILDPRERRILELRYELTPDGKSYTLREVGQKLDVTRERVRQIEARALKKLRHPLDFDIKERLRKRAVKALKELRHRLKEREQFVSRRLVIKIGSSTITHGAPDGEPLNRDFMDNIASQVSELSKAGVEVVIVSSGAVVSGKQILPELAGTTTFDNQVRAVFGQPELIAEWKAAFKKYGVKVGQMLLTDENLRNEKQAENTKQVLKESLKHGVVIINANDPVNNAEMIQFAISADNDKLASHVARLIKADTLMLLTDVSGVLDDDEVLPYVAGKMDDKADLMQQNGSGTGGMSSKYTAASEAAEAGIGIRSIIANGRELFVILRAARGELVGTEVGKMMGNC